MRHAHEDPLEGSTEIEELGRVGAGARWALSLPNSCVYTVRMSRINVYLPDELALQAKESGLNVSSLTQQAIRSALAADSLSGWLSRVSALDSTGVKHEAVVAAVAAAKDELEGHG